MSGHHPSIHPSIHLFWEKAGIRPRTDKEKKEKEADSIFCTVCNKDSLLTYLTLAGPRDEVGMYYQNVCVVFCSNFWSPNFTAMNELGVFCMNGQNLAMTSLSLSLSRRCCSCNPPRVLRVLFFVGQFCVSLWTSTHQCTMKDEC